jgi:hypothetical protein
MMKTLPASLAGYHPVEGPAFNADKSPRRKAALPLMTGRSTKD